MARIHAFTVPEPGVRLSLYTDLSLRLLVYLGGNPDGKPVGTARISEQLHVSTHHLHKVAQGLRKLGYVETVSGRLGGLRLLMPMDQLRIGDVVEAMEGSGRLADCKRGPCALNGACLLKSALDTAERNFIDELKRYTLSDVVKGPTLARLHKLLRAA